MRQRETRVIVDLQFGSTGKGLIAGYLAEENPCDTVVAAWRPNAGHTYIDRNGTKFVHTMLPNGVVSPNLERILIGPEAAINAESLAREIVDAAALLRIHPTDLLSMIHIHEHAAIVMDEHREREKKFVKIGSTMKGSAEAVIDKMRRDPDGRATAGQNKVALGYGLAGRVVSPEVYAQQLDLGRVIQVEGAQGFSLGINQRFYPHSTSRECTALQVLSDCGIPRANNNIEVIGTLRTYPIRVANRYADDCTHTANGAVCGQRALYFVHHEDVVAPPERHEFQPRQIGTSGPCYPDQTEITFEEIGQPVELTTVTKLPRRIFTFSEMQFRDALRANGPEYLFLNFMNYVPEQEWPRWWINLNNIANEYGSRIRWYSNGPTARHVETL
jgi:adenylosuccinate synthase